MLRAITRCKVFFKSTDETLVCRQPNRVSFCFLAISKKYYSYDLHICFRSSNMWSFDHSFAKCSYVVFLSFKFSCLKLKTNDCSFLAASSRRVNSVTMKTSRKVLRIYVTLKEHPDTFSYFNNLQKYNYAETVLLVRLKKKSIAVLFASKIYVVLLCFSKVVIFCHFCTRPCQSNGHDNCSL